MRSYKSLKVKLYRVVEGLDRPDDGSDKVNEFLDEMRMMDDGRHAERLDSVLGAGS